MDRARERRRRYQRHIPNSLRGITFETETAFTQALGRQLKAEFVLARSQSGVLAFLTRFSALNSAFDIEERACRAILKFLNRYEDVLHLGEEIVTRFPTIPDIKLCSRVLGRFAPELRAMFSSRLVEIMRGEVTDPDDHDPWTYAPSTWGAMVAHLSCWNRPEHRRVVVMALQDCGLLGSERDTRFLAVASLLAGGRTITFVAKPGTRERPATTVSMAIDREEKRMREIARTEMPWAAPAGWDEYEAAALDEDHVWKVREDEVLYAA